MMRMRRFVFFSYDDVVLSIRAQLRRNWATTICSRGRVGGGEKE